MNPQPENFQPETEVERYLYERLQECKRERDDAENAVTRVRAVLDAYDDAYLETLDKRRKSEATS